MSKTEGLGRVSQKFIETAGTELSYIVGNATEKSLDYADKFDQISPVSSFQLFIFK